MLISSTSEGFVHLHLHLFQLIFSMSYSQNEIIKVFWLFEVLKQFQVKVHTSTNIKHKAMKFKEPSLNLIWKIQTIIIIREFAFINISLFVFRNVCLQDFFWFWIHFMQLKYFIPHFVSDFVLSRTDRDIVVVTKFEKWNTTSIALTIKWFRPQNRTFLVVTFPFLIGSKIHKFM